MATKKDSYIYKTIEFTQVDKETEYVFTRLEPLLSGEIYTQYPNKKFIYNSYTELEENLMSIGLTSEEIQALQINQVNHYYEPLYTTKWYIAGLYDFMASPGYSNYTGQHASTDPYGMELLEYLIQDSQIESKTNSNLGFVFPERIMQLIYGKTINRLRMFVRSSSTIVTTSTDLQDYEKFHWIRVAELHSSTGRNNSIRLPGTTDTAGSYIWIMFGQQSGQTYTALSSQYQTSHTHIGISVNNMLNTPTTTISDYEWIEIPTSTSNANSGQAYAKLGLNTTNYINPTSFTIEFKYSMSANGTNPQDSLYDSSGNLCGYIGIKMTLQGYTSSYEYTWYKITDMTNVIPYYVTELTNKVYYLYIRFATNTNPANNNKNVTLYDNYFNSINYIAISFFNSTDITDAERYTQSEYYEYIPINLGYNNYQYTLSDGTSKRIWVKYGDRETGALSADNTNYGIYLDTQTQKNKSHKWLFIAWDKNTDSTPSTSASSYKLINLDNLRTTQQEVTLYTYSSQNGLQEDTEHFVWIRFADKLPVRYGNDMSRTFTIENTKFIGISIVDNFGKIHNSSNSSSSTPNMYCWLPFTKIETAQTTFNVDRYFYFTFAQDPAGARTQWPKNQLLLGYAYDQTTPLSKTSKTKSQEDKSSKSITLYRALKKNANTEQNLQKICSVEIPYTSMGKYAVFECDPFIINDGEYLVIGGNRDNICPLTIKESGVSTYSINNNEHIDYLKNNTEFKHYDDPEMPRELIPDGTVMYYKAANYMNNTWTPVNSNFLPIDLGCGFLSSSGEITVTTKTYKEIVAQTKDADAQALKKYQEEQQQNGYQSPNYDLYVNMTYKFAKIIDGTIDYMPLYNRYKIRYRFKNEKQEVLLRRIFDTSIMTPDGSVYNKPTSIDLDGQIYTQNQTAYEEYFDYIENDFPAILKVTDEGIDDNNYDVAYFQCKNILKELYKSNPDDPTAQQFSDDFYNYKFLSDEGYKNYLPVVCEITISAYDTATALFTKVVPVTLAAYSLVEITNDYIKTTVSKIENDYLYGLVQRTSRIEQYADRITMAVENATQGLYSKFQMTEEQILMEVVDISRNVGSQIQMAADKIQAVVYDVSNKMYSQILQEKNKISLEVASDFNKAGIYLYDDSAIIDAQTLLIRGDRTKIYGTLEIYQEMADGIVMFDDTPSDKIHITVEDIPSRSLLGGTADDSSVYMLNTTGNTTVPDTANTIFNIQCLSIIHGTQEISAAGNSLNIDKIEISGQFVNPFYDATVSNSQQYIDIKNIFNIHDLRFNITYIPETTISSANYGSRSLNNEDDNIYGANPGITFNWQYNGMYIDPAETPPTIIIYYNSATQIIPILMCSSNIKNNVDIISNNPDITLTKTYNNDGYYTLNLTYPNAIGFTTITASYNTGEVSDTAIFNLRITELGNISWQDNDGNDITSCILYFDDMNNNRYPILHINGGGINLSDITYENTNAYLKVNPETGRMYVDGNLPNSIHSITITARYSNNGDDITCDCIVYIDQHYKSEMIIIDSTTPGKEYNENNLQTISNIKYTNDSNEFGIYLNSNVCMPNNERVQLQIQNPPNNILLSVSIVQNSIKLSDNIKDGYIKSGNGWEYGFTTSKTTAQREGTDYTNIYNSMSDKSVLCCTDVKNHWNYNANNLIFTLKNSYNILPLYFFIKNDFSLSWGNGYNYVEIIFTNINTFKNIKKITLYHYTQNGYGGSNGRIQSILYNRSTYVDNIQSTEDLLYSSDLSMRNINISFESNNTVRCGFIISEAIVAMQTWYVTEAESSNLARCDRLEFELFNYSSGTQVSIKNISIQEIDTTLYRLLYISSDSSGFKFRNIKMKVTYGTGINAGTRIGKNGMYSYIDEKSLYYISGDLIEYRLNNNGLRLTKAGSQQYSGSAGLEVYYGSLSSSATWSQNWRETDAWVSLFNYNPILRFYAEPNNGVLVYHVPAQNKTYNTESGVWEGGTTDFINSNVVKGRDNVYSTIAGTAGYQVNDGGGYLWYYDIAYHRGIISIEQLQESHTDHGGRHYIMLPMKWHNGTSLELPIPVGFSITILNCQYFSKEDMGSGNYKLIGVQKKPVMVALANNNLNFIKRTLRGNTVQQDAEKGGFARIGNGNANSYFSNREVLPAQFLDAHGNLASAIKLTDTLGDYDGGYYVDKSFTTFIWTGFVWKCTCDDDGIFQLNPANEINNG